MMHELNMNIAGENLTVQDQVWFAIAEVDEFIANHPEHSTFLLPYNAPLPPPAPPLILLLTPNQLNVPPSILVALLGADQGPYPGSVPTNILL